jgi:hypothetical protein
MIPKSFANLCGVASIAIMCAFWICMRYVPAPHNVYLIFVGIPAVVLLALALAIVAAVRGSRWWLLSIVLPLSGIVAILSAAG